MHSKHAFILALMSGAAALLIVFGGLIGLGIIEAAEPYLTGREAEVKTADTATAPTLTTKIEGDSAQIVQLDKAGQVISVVYTSDLNDQRADFSLFAVPQTTYNGQAYVQSVQDAAGSTLIVYPLNVASGKIAPAVINVTSQHTTVSPEQNRVAVINASPTKNITAYDLATGTVLASWTLEASERLTESPSSVYTGAGVRWTSNTCFDHTVWTAAGMELRTFCLTDESN